MSCNLTSPLSSGKKVVIDCQNLSKFYKVYRKPIDRLKEVLSRRVYHQRVNALTEVSFNIHSGETWGLIGDNGAGKSTLLKILARTVMPAAGDLHIEGRVAALLELGSGFHPEFSGRENIYLNAALLGLSEAEIRQREKDIITFSELEEDIDRPVKTYSSGMYVRLAFAIATSVDPDILIIDEALAVGDNHFQQKCIKRLVDFRRQGKTILFCSHSMFLISELCDYSLLLEHGRLRMAGGTAEVVRKYLALQKQREINTEMPEEVAEEPTLETEKSALLPEVMIDSLELIDSDGRSLTRIKQFSRLVFRYRTRCSCSTVPGHLGFGIIDAEDHPLFTSLTHHLKMTPICFKGVQEGTIEIPRILLQGENFRAVLIVFDIYGVRVIDAKYSTVFAVEGERPDLGLVWMEHQWHLWDQA